jgi:excisionase family DNA binding protein
MLMPINDTLLTVHEVARKLRVSVRTVWRYEAAGKIPRAVHLGGNTVRWKARDIQDYLDSLKGRKG